MRSGYYTLCHAIVLFLFAGLNTASTAQVVVTTLGEEFKGSGGVSLHPNQEALYIGDFGDCFSQSDSSCWGPDVKRMTLDNGNGEVEVETFATGFIIASGNDFAADGDTLLQVQLALGRVYKVAPDGSKSLWETGFAGPVGIVATPDKGAFVAECGGGRISRISPAGERSILVENADDFNCPNGITRGPDGTLYTVNFNDGRMWRINPETGEYSLLATGPGGGNGHVRYSAGRLIVADRSGNQILSVSLDGEIEVIAGSGEEGNADGLASEATFIRPNGVAVSADGSTIYVSSKASDDPNDINPVLIRRISGLPVAGEEGPNRENQGLLPVAPNPSRGGATIRYTLDQPASVKLEIYSLLGQRVAVLEASDREAGEHAVTWNGTDGAGREVAAGTYLYSLRTDGGPVETRLLTLVR